MADEIAPTNDKPAVDATAASASSATNNGLASLSSQTADGKTFTQADVDRIIKDRLAREQAKATEAQAKAVADAEAKAMAEQGKYRELYEKQQAELTAKEQRIKAMELDSLRRSVASRLGLPDPLIDRLRGETVEEIENDAKALVAAMPKPAAPNINSTTGGAPLPVSSAQIAESKKRSGDYIPF